MVLLGKSRIGMIKSKQLIMKGMPKHEPLEMRSLAIGAAAGSLLMFALFVIFKPRLLSPLESIS